MCEGVVVHEDGFKLAIDPCLQREVAARELRAGKVPVELKRLPANQAALHRLLALRRLSEKRVPAGVAQPTTKGGFKPTRRGMRGLQRIPSARARYDIDHLVDIGGVLQPERVVRRSNTGLGEDERWLF